MAGRGQRARVKYPEPSAMLNQHMKAQRTSKRMMTAYARQRAALELRIEGKTFDEIAAALKYRDRSGAWVAVTSAMERGIAEPAKELIELTTMRLDKLLAAIWPKAMTGDAQAIATVLRVERQRADLLGLAAPRMIDIRVEARRIAEAEGLDEDELVALASAWIKEQSGA